MNSTIIIIGFIIIPVLLIISIVFWFLQRKKNLHLTQQLEEKQKERPGSGEDRPGPVALAAARTSNGVLAHAAHAVGRAKFNA